MELRLRMKGRNVIRRSGRRSFAGTALLLGALLALSPHARALDKVAAGEGVYNNYCFTCHGENLVSSGQTFDLRRLKAADRQRFENSVLNGKNQMPPWKGVVTVEEIDQLWHYIRANATN
jgi:mono/diheme cytochrome c family protein